MLSKNVTMIYLLSRFNRRHPQSEWKLPQSAALFTLHSACLWCCHDPLTDMDQQVLGICLE